MSRIIIDTPRLRLRDWRDDDVDRFAAMNADPAVMAHFPAPLTREETEAVVGRIRAHLAGHGFGLWAVEIPGVTRFAGFIGLSHVRFEAPFAPAIEIGWRLAVPFWGAGYATEGARAALAYAFDVLGLDEVVSFTIPANLRSQRVMQRIGMQRDPAGDFDHPLLPDGHRIRRHVLYRARRPGRASML